MKISIITITYNSADTLSDTIESVLSQNHTDIEYIIVDGKSTDGTLDVIKSYGRYVTKYISEPDKGLYDALNKGISMATGDIIGFVHSDDVLAGKDVLQTIAETFETYQTDSVYGDLVYVDRLDPFKVIRYWRSGKYDRNKMARGWMPPHPTFYVRREVYQRYGGFDTSYRISSDYDFMLRMLHKHRITSVYIPMILVKMRVGGESNRSLRNIMRKIREDIRTMRTNDLNYIPGILNKNLSKVRQFIPPKTVSSQINYIPGTL